MKEHIGILRVTRKNMLGVMDSLSTEQLNKIPQGYRNNVLWNIAHCVVTQQLLVYKLSGVAPRVPDEFIEKFRKGSAPKETMSEQEINDLKALLTHTVEWMQEDYFNSVFDDFKRYETSYGVTLTSTEEAIQFNNVHEALHLGYAMSLRKLL